MDEKKTKHPEVKYLVQSHSGRCDTWNWGLTLDSSCALKSQGQCAMQIRENKETCICCFLTHQCPVLQPFLVPAISFVGKTIFPQTSELGSSFGMIQVHYTFTVDFISIINTSASSDHQPLDPGGWEPLS